jgi:hypothetical protein
VEHLNGLEPEGLDAVEHALAAAEQDGCDVEVSSSITPALSAMFRPMT